MKKLNLLFLAALGAILLVACAAPAAAPAEEAPAEEDMAEEDMAEEEAPADAEGPTIVVSNWDAYMPEDLIPNFEAETGINVELSLHATNEEIVGKLVASGGEGYDVVFMSGQFAQALYNQGLVAELDKDMIPNTANLLPEVADLAHDPGTVYSIPYAWGTTGLCYRSDLVGDFQPTSWNDVLEPPEELSGQITMLATERWLMLPAQKALGFSVNTTDEAEMAQVQEALIGAQDTLLAYDDTTFYSKLVSGEASMVVAWDGWCNYGIAENPDIAFTIPEEGSDLWVDTMVVPEASQNKEAAHAFIDYVLREDVGVDIVNLTLYKVPTTAMAQVDQALLDQFPTLSITSEQLLQQEQLLDLGDAQPLYTNVSTEVMASQ